jgi:hypothetical protein
MTYKNEVMAEIEKEYPESSEIHIKVGWCIDDTIFLLAIILAGLTAILAFIR